MQQPDAGRQAGQAGRQASTRLVQGSGKRIDKSHDPRSIPARPCQTPQYSSPVGNASRFHAHRGVGLTYIS